MINVKSSIEASLREAHGTLISNALTDLSDENVVIFLLSITGTERVSRTFFLRSIYSGSHSCDAAFYANILAEGMLSIGSMKRVCAVASDNTGCCLKANDILIERHDHLHS